MMKSCVKKFRDNNGLLWHQIPRVHWGRLVLIILGFVGLSFLFTYLSRGIMAQLQLSPNSYSRIAYLTSFLSLLVINLTVIAPVPVGISIMVTAAAQGDPVIVALVGSLGAAIGEFSGYFAGYFGRKVALSEDKVWSERFHNWVRKYGGLAIFVLSLQPILPFDIAGITAGAVKMPIRHFWPALWAGRFLKYLLFIYSGMGIIQYIPFLSN